MLVRLSNWKVGALSTVLNDVRWNQSKTFLVFFLPIHPATANIDRKTCKRDLGGTQYSANQLVGVLVVRESCSYKRESE
jgi:hypothetical protein